MKIFKKISTTLLSLLGLALATHSLAALQLDPNARLKTIAGNAQYNTNPSSPQVVIMALVQIALGFVGIILVCLILYAGFTWMTAGGNDDKIKKSQKTILNSAIGLLIILASYAITKWLQYYFFRSIDTGYYGYY